MMSLLGLPAASIGEIIYFKDYWSPASIFSLNLGGLPVYLEDLIFGFCIVGIGGVIYEFIFRENLIKPKKTIQKKLSLSIILGIAALESILLYNFGMNSIFATSFGFITAALFIVSLRRDLFLNSLLSALAVMLIMLLSYLILFNAVSNSEELLKHGWKLYDTFIGVRFFKIPITEMIWGFAWGSLAGPLYEFSRGLRLKKEG